MASSSGASKPKRSNTRKKPAAKKAGGSGSAKRKAASSRSASAGRSDKSVQAFRDAVERSVGVLEANVVTVPRDRLQEVVDDAVQRGRMTRSDATDLVTEIFSRGRRTTEDLLGDIDQLLGGPSDRIRREVDKARRATGIGPSFPVIGYDDLSAAQVQSRLEDLTPAELRKVRDYERRNANRKTVLSAIESKLA
jgi:polyhydroxyalkanoate synthesis regulator phasin